MAATVRSYGKSDKSEPVVYATICASSFELFYPLL
jgi:hypothetical protein